MASAPHRSLCPPTVTISLTVSPAATYDRTGSLSTYVAPATAATRANACGNSPHPYTGESNAPTVGPNRPNDATYLARDSNPGPDNACTSSLSARAYCTAAASRGERPCLRSRHARNGSCGSGHRLSPSPGISPPSPGADSPPFRCRPPVPPHSLPGAPIATFASSGSPLPTTSPASLSASATTRLRKRMSARLSPGGMDLSLNTSALDAGTGDASPSHRSHV
mmetsp:Transcript_12204/g.55543  ORF Transcript_12204/g.55543 Transcript_12204/m.55543 type:complete len:223 (-) Transcript_12204:518-1186(-)